MFPHFSRHVIVHFTLQLAMLLVWEHTGRLFSRFSSRGKGARCTRHIAALKCASQSLHRRTYFQLFLFWFSLGLFPTGFPPTEEFAFLANNAPLIESQWRKFDCRRPFDGNHSDDRLWSMVLLDHKKGKYSVLIQDWGKRLRSSRHLMDGI